MFTVVPRQGKKKKKVEDVQEALKPGDDDENKEWILAQVINALIIWNYNDHDCD